MSKVCLQWVERSEGTTGRYFTISNKITWYFAGSHTFFTVKAFEREVPSFEFRNTIF